MTTVRGTLYTDYPSRPKKHRLGPAWGQYARCQECGDVFSLAAVPDECSGVNLTTYPAITPRPVPVDSAPTPTVVRAGETPVLCRDLLKAVDAGGKNVLTKSPLPILTCVLIRHA